MGAAQADATHEESVRDSFSHDDAAGAWLPETREWIVRDSAYQFTEPLREGSCTWRVSPVFSDLEFTVGFRILPEGAGVRAAGMVFRSVSSVDQYYVHFDSKYSQVILVRETREEPWHELARIRDVTITPGEWHEGRVECEGPTIRVFLDGQPICEAKDGTLSAGRIGLRAGQGHIMFDDVRVEGVVCEPEREWVLVPNTQPKDELDVPRFTAGERYPMVRGGGYFPVIVRFADGRLGAVVRGGAPHIGILGRLDWVASNDGGRTWTTPTVIADSQYDDRNPAAGVMADGTVVVAYAEASTYNDKGDFDTSVGNYDMFYKLSTDGGANWSEKLPLPHGPIKLGSPYGRIAVLGDGTALMSVYGSRNPEYAGPVVVPPGTGGLVGILRSTDNGRTWGDFTLVRAGGHNETTFLPLSDTHILAALRTEPAGNIDVAESTDAGRTWSEPRPVTRPGQHPADLVGLGHGRIAMVYGNRLTPFGIEAVISADGGRTWAYDHRVLLAWDSIHGDCGYPSIVAVDDDTLAVAYYSVGVQSDPQTEFAFLLRVPKSALLHACKGE